MRCILYVLSAFIFFQSTNIIAGSSPKEPHLFTMTMTKISYNNLQDFLTFYENELKAMNLENEYILSEKVYTHVWGPDWTVCIILEYKDMEGMAASDKKGGEIFMKHYPDKSSQDEFNRKTALFFDNHTDAIVIDNPGLEK